MLLLPTALILNDIAGADNSMLANSKSRFLFIFRRYSATIQINVDQYVLCASVSSYCCLFKPSRSDLIIILNAITVEIHTGKVVLGFSIVLCG